MKRTSLLLLLFTLTAQAEFTQNLHQEESDVVYYVPSEQHLIKPLIEDVDPVAVALAEKGNIKVFSSILKTPANTQVIIEEPTTAKQEDLLDNLKSLFNSVKETLSF